MGMLTLNSNSNGNKTPIVEAVEEKEKLLAPNIVHPTPANAQNFDDKGNLTMTWEYWDDCSACVESSASVEFKFFLASEEFNENEDYPSLIKNDRNLNVSSNDIVNALKKANYQSPSTIKVAMRYLAKENSKYLSSDYYIVSNLAGEVLSHTYEIEYIDPSDYNVYMFGPGAQLSDWDFHDYTKLKLDTTSEIYSIEYEFAVGMFKIYLLPSSEIDQKASFSSRKESGEIQIKKNGTYKFQFTFKNHKDFTLLDIADPLDDGYYHLEYLSTIDTNSANGNVLLNKDVYSTATPTDPKTYTNGDTGGGYQIPADSEGKNRVKKTFYLWDLEQTYPLDKINIYWQTSCPTEYNIFVSTEEIDDLESFEYIDVSSATWSNWTLFKNVTCQQENHTDNLSLDKPVLARYILLQTVEASDDAWKNWGYWLHEIEAFATTNHLLYGAQVGKSENANAIRFIGLAKIEDVATYSDDVVLELTYRKDDDIRTRDVSINNYYKTLTTSLNGVSNVTLNADEIITEDTEGNYYFFSFTLIGILEGTYEITLKVNDLKYQTITYNFDENEVLSRVE